MFSRRDVLVSVAALGGAALSSARLAAAAAVGRVLTVPIELDGARLVAPCSIAGHGPYLFAIDTGGLVSLIRNGLASQLGFRAGRYSMLNVGGRLDRYPLFDVNDMTFGNSFRQNHVVLAGVDHIRFGDDVFGSLAAGCLTAYDSEIDFNAKEWRVYPGGGPAHDGWLGHDAAIVNDGPDGGSSYLFGRAQLGSQPLRCMLDTGSPGWLRLSGEPARRSGILSAGQNWSPAGKRDGDVARIVRSSQPLNFGGVSVPRPLVLVQNGSAGRLSDALIGLPVLQQLNIATDVRRRQLWTRPNGLSRPLERYNMSGLWIDRRGDRLFTGEVGKGSPAEQAGIVPGDRIEGVDLEPLIASLNGPAGTTTSFTVIRGGQRRDVTLELRDYL